jgi:DNA (cytosine-5)-methyltransferase 1
VLDAQYFGVAQRRRRVFVVGHLGDWRAAAEVLFEPESLRRDPAPSREKGQEVAGTFTARARSGGWSHDPNLAAGGYMQPVVPSVAGSLDTECGGGKLTHQSVANGHLIGTITARMFQSLGARDVEEGAVMPVTKPIALADISSRDKSQNGSGWKDDGTMYTLDTTGLQGVAQPIPLDTMNIRGRPSDDGRANRIGRGYGEAGDPMFTITKANHHAVAQPISFGAQMSNPQTDVDMVQTLQAKNPMAVAQPIAPTLTATNDPSRSPQSTEVTNQVAAVHAASMAVRRLTPVECERLQGFPDGYTNIPWRKQPESPDGPRYKALGNSMAVPVMGWIGKRIQMRADA